MSNTISAAAAPSKRGRPSISRIDRNTIVEAALEIVDAEGPRALNLRRLAKALELDSPSSLYNYFKNKDELELALARHIVAKVRPPKTARIEWRTWVVDAAAAYHLTLLHHPKAIPLILELQPRTFGSQVFEFASQLMLDDGVASEDVEALFRAFEALAAGSAWNTAVKSGSTASHTAIDALDEQELDRWFRKACQALAEGLTPAYRSAGGGA